jgi:hypothetical protein
MDSTAWLIVGLVIVVVAIAGLLWWRSQQAKREHLKEQFGPEYDRAVAEVDDKREAESRLASVEKRRRSLRISPLRDESRLRYHQQWNDVQAAFVDQPLDAVLQGDLLVVAVMRERGYPMDDFDEQASMIAIDHPDVVENYREAHAIADRARERDATTEELRRAFVRYRSLFQALVGQAPEDDRAGERRPGDSAGRVGDEGIGDGRVGDGRGGTRSE